MGEVIIFGKKNFKKINNNMNVDQTYIDVHVCYGL